MPKPHKYTIAIDFDGVIHRYSKGYHDGTAYDEPMKHAFESLDELMQTYTVFVFTTRELTSVQDWFARHSFKYPTQIITDQEFWTVEKVLGLSNRKIPAFIYLDDRGYRFTKWNKAMTDLEHILPKG